MLTVDQYRQKVYETLRDVENRKVTTGQAQRILMRLASRINRSQAPKYKVQKTGLLKLRKRISPRHNADKLP